MKVYVHNKGVVLVVRDGRFLQSYENMPFIILPLKNGWNLLPINLVSSFNICE